MGAFYPWFDSVTLNPNGRTITITANPEYTGDDNTLRMSATIGAGDIRRALVAILAYTHTPGDEYHSYESRAYRDLLARDYDEYDGDANTVDCVLQVALWGSVVFS